MSLFIVACQKPDDMTTNSFHARSFDIQPRIRLSLKKMKLNVVAPNCLFFKKNGAALMISARPCQNCLFRILFNAINFTLKQLAAVRVNWAFLLLKNCIEISKLFERPDDSRSSQCTFTSTCGIILGRVPISSNWKRKS